MELLVYQFAQMELLKTQKPVLVMFVMLDVPFVKMQPTLSVLFVLHLMSLWEKHVPNAQYVRKQMDTSVILIQMNVVYVILNVMLVQLMLMIVLNVLHQEKMPLNVLVQMVASMMDIFVLTVTINVLLVKVEMNVQLVTVSEKMHQTVIVQLDIMMLVLMHVKFVKLDVLLVMVTTSVPNVITTL